MEVAACEGCKRLFNYIGGSKLCPECREKYEDTYKKVKEYVYDHRGCTINDVSKDCEVSAKEIRQWVREGKLEFTNAAGSGITCRVCGKAVASGDMCPECRSNLEKEMSAQLRKDAPVAPVQAKVKSENKMRYFK